MRRCESRREMRRACDAPNRLSTQEPMGYSIARDGNTATTKLQDCAMVRVLSFVVGYNSVIDGSVIVGIRFG